MSFPTYLADTIKNGIPHLPLDNAQQVTLSCRIVGNTTIRTYDDGNYYTKLLLKVQPHDRHIEDKISKMMMDPTTISLLNGLMTWNLNAEKGMRDLLDSFNQGGMYELELDLDPVGFSNTGILCPWFLNPRLVDSRSFDAFNGYMAKITLNIWGLYFLEYDNEPRIKIDYTISQIHITDSQYNTV